jgi:hypothetical protein
MSINYLCNAQFNFFPAIILPEDREYIHSKGIDTIRSHAIDSFTSRLAPAFPKNDGKQTPRRGHPVFIAQHAAATCCRGCIWKWHRIEKGEGAFKKRNRLGNGGGDGVDEGTD